MYIYIYIYICVYIYIYMYVYYILYIHGLINTTVHSGHHHIGFVAAGSLMHTFVRLHLGTPMFSWANIPLPYK